MDIWEGDCVRKWHATFPWSSHDYYFVVLKERSKEIERISLTDFPKRWRNVKATRIQGRLFDDRYKGTFRDIVFGDIKSQALFIATKVWEKNEETNRISGKIKREFSLCLKSSKQRKCKTRRVASSGKFPNDAILKEALNKNEMKSNYFYYLLDWMHQANCNEIKEK